MNKKLSKYIATFDYFNKILIFFLSATSGGASIISFTTVIGVPVGTLSASFSHFFFNYRNHKKVIVNNKK